METEMAEKLIPVYSKLPRPIDYLQRNPIDLWTGMHHSPLTTALWDTHSSLFLRPPTPSPPKHSNNKARTLSTKTPSHSRTVVLYNFSTDFILREQYRGHAPRNHLRIGKLLQDLDALAGTVSVKHCSDDDIDDDRLASPLILVTASVHKIVLRCPLSVDDDLKISASVVWVGNSSIEVQLEVTHSSSKENSSPDRVALTANFIFVARDSKTGKAAQVNRILPETDMEKLLFQEAEARNKLKKRKRGEGTRAYEGEEISRLEALLAEGRIFCDMPALADRNSILLRDTRLENSMVCQPQQRNIHGRIFGGFLMHRAFELAFSTAYVFAGTIPCFLEVDRVDFLRPVDVGDFLRFKSCVLYTEHEDSEHPLMNVEVVAHVTRPEIRSSEVSNTFYFTFTVFPESKNVRNGSNIRKVVPATEEEARRILERSDAKALQSIKSPTKIATTVVHLS